MDEREYHIYELLQEADEFAYIPEDKSDLYALAPPHMSPGLIKIPGEYTDLDEDGLIAHIDRAMAAGAWSHIPLSREWMNDPQ